jgi:hypothetical protein
MWQAFGLDSWCLPFLSPGMFYQSPITFLIDSHIDPYHRVTDVLMSDKLEHIAHVLITEEIVKFVF